MDFAVGHILPPLHDTVVWNMVTNGQCFCVLNSTYFVRLFKFGTTKVG